ncbi:MAG: hypothetical protein ARM1_0220 [Candidatus Micrarchaeota archaeon]|nr:MAG: hypothetical protein ARM1_0220 [Candidatus Micrarchaeota archaeon]
MLPLTIAIFYRSITPINMNNYIYLVIGIISGILYPIASLCELEAVSKIHIKTISKEVIKRNFINDFEYADTLIVLLGSVIIGSYKPIQIFGGLLIVASILIISHLNNS